MVAFLKGRAGGGKRQWWQPFASALLAYCIGEAAGALGR